MYSAIFSFSSESVLLGDISSATKSGQRCPNLSRSALGRASNRSRLTHDTSGLRTAEFGSVNPADESKGIPVPSVLDQFASAVERSMLRQLLFSPAGGMMISSFW